MTRLDPTINFSVKWPDREWIHSPLSISNKKIQSVSLNRLQKILLSFETVEASVVALVGGEFKFPENTVLVSAVYSVSVSKPLLNSLTLEIQHCVDLRGQPGLSQYLKFAIAPADTPSLPYQFRIIEGGEFSSNSRYGSIQRKEFCLVCILGEETIKGIPLAPTDGDLEEGQEEQQQGQKDQSATDGYPFTVSTSVSTTPLNEAKNKSEVVTKITKPNSKYVHIYK